MNKTAKDLWKPKRRIELIYQKSLRKIMKSLEKKLSGLTNLADILRVLKKFTQSKEFKDHAEAEAKKMVTSVFSDAGKTWREAARVNSKSKEIYEALKKEFNSPMGATIKEQIERNSDLIKSMPKDIRKEITEIVARESQSGRRASDIAEDLQERFPQMLKNKANLIARTETSKTESALTQARSKNIGINWYEWNTSEDSRVRSSHKHMDTVLINWNNPPSPESLIGVKSTLGKYHAGCCPNCRCFCSPVVRVSFLTFPHKVFYKDKIVTMTLKEFENIM